jgi:PadR family transcriptional regulator, regulatory protein PadR
LGKADKLQGSLDLLVLKVLSRRPNIHGYAISAAVRDVSDEVLQIEDGSLYPALYRMEEAGWIQAKWITKDNGGRSRVYELAAEGKKQLRAEEARWRNVSLAIDRVLRTV